MESAWECIKTVWPAAVRRSGLTGTVRPYSLRPHGGPLDALHGVPADEEVAQQLGHRQLGTTGVYTDYDPEYLKAACDALDTLPAALLPRNYPVCGRRPPGKPRRIKSWLP
jgi:integrase